MRERSKQSLMEAFAASYGQTLVSLRESAGRQWLEVDEPVVLASFVAFCSVPLYRQGLRVYLRGQSRLHRHLEPSLFRGIKDPSERRRRWSAYRHFLSNLPQVVKGTRFTKKNFGAVLQHYGFGTPWLDVVDDLHVAIWFALNNFAKVKGECHYSRSTEKQGWLVLVATSRGHRVLNLRRGQSSRNVRCHAQQGFSIAMQHDDAPAPEGAQDFIAHVVGTVRIPNVQRWWVNGFRASQQYFFPSSELDSTYRKLLNPKVEVLARQSEVAHGLTPGILGGVARYYPSDMHGEPSKRRVEPTPS